MAVAGIESDSYRHLEFAKWHIASLDWAQG